VVVVLCEVADLPALWAAQALERRGLEVEVVSASVLSCALRWEHRVSRDGASASLQLADGRRLSSERPVGVLNRVTSVSPDRFVAVAGADRDYALQEMFAMLLSVLHALPGPVVNRPTPHGLCGAWRHPSEWTALAAEVGLPAASYRQSSAAQLNGEQSGRSASGATAFVVGDRVVASVPGIPASVLDGCRRLARLARETLLGVHLVRAPRWAMSGATVTPDFQLGGEPLVDALAEVLAT
jgi:hypothetical protein